MTCLATARQHGTEFVIDLQPHLDPPVTGRAVKVKVVAKIKEIVETKQCQSVTGIAERFVAEINIDCPLEALPTVRNLARVENWRRRKYRPREPRNLDFELNFTSLSQDFFQADVIVDVERHIIFATHLMLQLLSRAKR